MGLTVDHKCRFLQMTLTPSKKLSVTHKIASNCKQLMELTCDICALLTRELLNK